MATVIDFIAKVKSTIGTPYRWGGIDPFHGGADCSGLMYWAAAQCGMVIPRSSSAQWNGLPHVSNPSPGDLVFFNVPSDGPPQPAHVGMYLSPGQMIEDPCTGQTVHQAGIPNNAGESVMGYARIPFAQVTPPTPIPTPNPLPPETDDMDDNMFIRWCYMTVLLRTVDASGFSANMAWLNAGGPRSQVYTNLCDSAEGQNVTKMRRKSIGLDS